MYLCISEVCFWMLEFPMYCQVILPVLLKLVYSVYIDASCEQSSICQRGAFASAVRSQYFHELRIICDHGEKSGFWSPCIQSHFLCSRSQCANVPNLDNC